MKVVVLTTGGTIASTASRGGVVASLDGARLLRGAGVAGEDVEVVDLLRVGSYAMTVEQLGTVARAARDHAARREVAGVVVTHGTDTMEETAYLTDLLHHGAEPIVFTGAQRHADDPFSDGPANLAAALRVARAPQARGLGAVVCMDGRLDAARDVVKLHTSAARGFGAPDAGPVAELGPSGLRVLRRPERSLRVHGAGVLEPNVGLVKLAAGMDAALLDAAAGLGMRALVLEAFGLGNATPAIVATVGRLVARGTLVVVCSRCLGGGVHPVYGNGGGADLAAAGALFAGALAGPKARVLLMLALAEGCTREEIRALLRAEGGAAPAVALAPEAAPVLA